MAGRLTEGDILRVYNLSGTLVYAGAANSDKAEIPLPARGIYAITNGKEAIKVVY